MSEPTSDVAQQSEPQAAPAPSAPETPPTPVATRTEELPDWAQKEIREARNEAAKNRIGKNEAEQAQQETLAKIAQALGLQKEDTPPDPVALERTLTEREQRVQALESDSRAKDLEIAAWRTASRVGANASALLDSRSFLTAVGQMDPTSENFDADLESVVKKAMETNPSLRAALAAPAGRAGIGVSGGGDSLEGKSNRELLRQGYGSTQH